MNSYIKQFALFENIYAKYARLKRLGLVAATEDTWINTLWPEKSHYIRARSLANSVNPIARAVSMADTIDVDNREKLVLLAKAVIATLKRFRPDLLGEVFEPFAKRMAEVGFTENQIYWTLEFDGKYEYYTIDDEPVPYGDL